MNRCDLLLLFSRGHTAERSALSIYLSVDQAKQENLNRGFERRLKKMAAVVQKATVDIAEQDRFATAIHHMREFVSAYVPAAKSLALFFDASDEFFSHYELDFPVSDRIHWNHELLLQPLAGALDQLEAYGVILLDRAKMRLFVVSLGRIDEIAHEDLDAKKVRHIKTVGTDNAGSSSRVQRKADNQVTANLGRAVRRMEELEKSRKLRGFVLAGTREITAALRNLLPGHLQPTVIGEAVIPMGAARDEVLSLTRPFAERYELETEVQKVNDVVASAKRDGKAVVGLKRTLMAINSDRVWEVIYAGDYLSPGFECSQCAALFSARPSRCPYCGARIQAVVNVVEKAVEHALRRQARVEVVTGNASEALRNAGGIGAFLKTRTGTIES
jgi:peptide subunit release factor 1 (eRF1)